MPSPSSDDGNEASSAFSPSLEPTTGLHITPNTSPPPPPPRPRGRGSRGRRSGSGAPRPTILLRFRERVRQRRALGSVYRADNGEWIPLPDVTGGAYVVICDNNSYQVRFPRDIAGNIQEPTEEHKIEVMQQCRFEKQSVQGKRDWAGNPITPAEVFVFALKSIPGHTTVRVRYGDGGALARNLDWTLNKPPVSTYGKKVRITSRAGFPFYCMPVVQFIEPATGQWRKQWPSQWPGWLKKSWLKTISESC